MLAEDVEKVLEGKVAVRTKEKLVVEFEVEKTVKKDFGYEEKYLRYRGESLEYKAIVKDGNVLAIVSAGYKLLENEKVEIIAKEIARKHGFAIEVVKDGDTRIYAFLYDEDGGVCIRNSVDGSLSFGIDMVIMAGKPIPLKANKLTDNVKVIKRKHVGNMEKLLTVVEPIVLELHNTSKEYKDFLAELDKKLAKDHVVELKELLEEIPKKYKGTILSMLMHGLGDTITLKEVYENIAIKIWQEKDVSMRRKFDLLQRLNEAMAILISYDKLIRG